MFVPISWGNDHCIAGTDSLPDRAYLTECRPEPVSRNQAAAALQGLPPRGAITSFSTKEQKKLSAISQVLAFHGRSEVYSVRVIDVPQAWTGLHARAVLLVSRPALDLLSAAELQALAAHEVGHDYVFGQYQAARLASDNAALRTLETFCDALAVLRLEAIGVPPVNLSRALKKVFLYNQLRFGRPSDEARYPPVRERTKLIAAFAARKPPAVYAAH